MRPPLVLAFALLLAACETPTPAPAPPPVAGGFPWRTLAQAPSKRTEVAAALSGKKIVVAGGYRGDGATVATVEIFDTATNRWETGPPLPVPVNHSMAATVAGVVHVFGGYDGSNRPFAGGFKLTPTGWQSVANLPEPRAAGTAAVAGDKVYVAGGIGPGGSLASSMLVYDPATDAWAKAPGPPTPREHLGGAGFGGKVYTIGGRTGAGNLAAVEVFDPGTGKWSALPPLPTARGGMSAAATCNGHLVAVGGEAADTFDEAEAFGVKSGSWISLPPMPTARHGLGVVAVGTVVYTLSGGPKPGLHVSSDVEAVDLLSLGGC